jgi:C1A family cysteine protease
MTNPKKYKIDGFIEGVMNGLTTADAIKKALGSKGPVITNVTLYQNIYSYSGGIYTPSGLITGSDAQLIVGYNDTEGYWILRPSFDTWWGENGYYRMAYSNTSDIIRIVYALNNVINN